jgi:hypothetical protein
MRCIELPIVGTPFFNDVYLDALDAEFVKLVGWSNGAALYMAKNPAPISPTRPLNPHAPWMQGVGYLVVRDSMTKQMMTIDLVDNAIECLDAYNAWKKEHQHQCLFPGSVGHLVGSAMQRLMSAAARTKFAAFVQDADDDKTPESPRESSKARFH